MCCTKIIPHRNNFIALLHVNVYYLIDSNNRLGVASPSQYANVYTEPLHGAISSFFSLSQDLVLLGKNGNLHSLRQSKDGSADVLRVEASHVVLLLLSSSLEVGVGKDHWSDLEVAVVKSSVQSEEVQDVVTETTDAALLNSNQNTVLISKFPNHINVQRLHESSIRNSNSDIGILLLNLVRRNESLGQSSTERKNGHAVLLLLSAGVTVSFAIDSPRLANDASLTDGQELACK